MLSSYAIIIHDDCFCIVAKNRIENKKLYINFNELDGIELVSKEKVVEEIEKKTAKYFSEICQVKCYPEGTETVKKITEIALKNLKEYGHFDCE